MVFIMSHSTTVTMTNPTVTLVFCISSSLTMTVIMASTLTALPQTLGQHDVVLPP